MFQKLEDEMYDAEDDDKFLDACAEFDDAFRKHLVEGELPSLDFYIEKEIYKNYE